MAERRNRRRRCPLARSSRPRAARQSRRKREISRLWRSALLHHLAHPSPSLPWAGHIASIHIVIQLEVAPAHRRPSRVHRDYGYLSITCEYYTHPEIAFKIPARRLSPSAKGRFRSRLHVPARRAPQSLGSRRRFIPSVRPGVLRPQAENPSQQSSCPGSGPNRSPGLDRIRLVPECPRRGIVIGTISELKCAFAPKSGFLTKLTWRFASKPLRQKLFTLKQSRAGNST